ncbi:MULTISPECIES: hypothetical protein [unclassified Nocardioides]|uniref:hypothetical protein n=1 Tax=unclassified Nocardioides TaxID=2615069 RepID=UPI000B08BD77|nr:MULTISPECIES: hypothetical protein [unclassified Nocardioides]
MTSREVRRFALHYGEMVLAMVIGMMALHPLWTLAVSGTDPQGVLRSVEVDSLAMATTMAVPMGAWMRFRGHAWRPVLEMSGVMYAGFVVLFPFLWAGLLGEDGVMVLGHVLMFLLMFVAMLWRSEEYVGTHAHHGDATRLAGSGAVERVDLG